MVCTAEAEVEAVPPMRMRRFITAAHPVARTDMPERRAAGGRAVGEQKTKSVSAPITPHHKTHLPEVMGMRQVRAAAAAVVRVVRARQVPALYEAVEAVVVEVLLETVETLEILVLRVIPLLPTAPQSPWDATL
jgi:hypothetical protein